MGTVRGGATYRWVVLLTAVVAVLTTATALAAQPGPQVAAAVQVTQNPDPVRNHTSPQIAVNPTNGELVIVEADVRGDERCTVHLSTDDGRSWFRGGDPMVEPLTDCSLAAEYGPYATLAFGRDGVLYVAFVASEHLQRARDDTPRHVQLARSTDGGRTFDTTTVYQPGDGNPDRDFGKGPMLAVDPEDSDRVYVGWRQGVFRGGEEKLKSNVAASADGGRTFGAPVDLSDDRGGDYPALAVGPDGAVHAVYWTRNWGADPDAPPPVRPIVYLRSADFGATFERQELDPGNQSTQRPPQIAADPGSNAVYVVWAGHAEAVNDADDFDGDLEIFLRRSGDGGATWSDRQVLNDDDNGVEQFLPGLAIAPHGRVDVAWYDNRLSPFGADVPIQDVYLASSTDQGRTWSDNVRVTDRSMDRTIGTWDNDISSNHNVGLASSDAKAYLAWQDTRAGDALTQSEDVYMAAVAVTGAFDAATSPQSGPPLWWTAGGAAAAFAISGLVLLIGARTRRPARSGRAARPATG